MDAHGFWFIVGVSVVPVPFQIAMLARRCRPNTPSSGSSSPRSCPRGLRYFGLAVLVYFIGDQTEAFIKRNKVKAIVIGSLLVLGIWAATTFLGS